MILLTKNIKIERNAVNGLVYRLARKNEMLPRSEEEIKYIVNKIIEVNKINEMQEEEAEAMKSYLYFFATDYLLNRFNEIPFKKAADLAWYQKLLTLNDKAYSENYINNSLSI